MGENYDRGLPPNSKRITTGCQYCAVGCGYNAFLVPVPENGELPDPADSHEGVSRFITPAMTNIVRYCGVPHQAAIAPDVRCDLNKGNHSVRGGSQGENLVRHDGAGRSTSARLVSPQVRLSNGTLANIDWDTLYRVMATLVIETTGIKPSGEKLDVDFPERLGVKIYEYQYLENTYAATKLFYSAIGTPNVAYHDRPSAAGSSPALADVGFRPHDFAYDDLRAADVIFFIGTNPYENQSVAFMQHCVGKELIVLDPRRTATAQYAEATGGLHLQPGALGADALVIYAMARAILERNPDWDTSVFNIGANADHATLPDSKSDEQRRKSRTMTLEQFRQFLGLDTATDDQASVIDPNAGHLYSLQTAADESRIKFAKLSQAVDRLAKPRGFGGGPMRTPRVAILYEKGIIWGFNYHGIAAIGSLGLLLGAYSEPGRLVGRVGGHQKGWARCQKDLGNIFTKSGEGYPWRNVTDGYKDEHHEPPGPGNLDIKLHHNLDLHVFGPPPELLPDGFDPDSEASEVILRNGVTTVAKPDVRLLWIIGGNYFGQTNDSQRKLRNLKKNRLEIGGTAGDIRRPDTTSEADILEAFRARLAEPDGLVVVHQELFANPTTEFCDIVIPAAGWGEDDFIRYNAQRRLKLYGRFQDMPLHEDDDLSRKKKPPKNRDPMRPSVRKGQEILRLEQFHHSPRPDWMIFRDIARAIAAIMDGKKRPETEPQKLGSFEKTLRPEFDWKNSANVADEMAMWSHRGVAGIQNGKPSLLGDLYLYGLNQGLKPEEKGGVLHRLLGAGSDEANTHDFLKQPGYSIDNESEVYGNGVATNGVMLPVVGVDANNATVTQNVRDENDKIDETLVKLRQDAIARIRGTLRVSSRTDPVFSRGKYFFVRAPWSQIKGAFDRINSGANAPGKVLVTNGRFNHLWNNMFHHIRNDYINERYPEDLPGTILELNPDWVKEQRLGLINGQVVDVKSGGNHFRAIVSLQESVANGSAFALFSYPIITATGEKAFAGQANRITDGYFDGIHPIAALKYSFATIEKVKNPENGSDTWVYPDDFDTKRLGPVFAERNKITLGPTPKIPDPFADPAGNLKARLKWEMRELIVTKGLPRALVIATEGGAARHSTETRALFLDPDRFVNLLSNPAEMMRIALSEFALFKMKYERGQSVIDNWKDQEIKQVGIFRKNTS